MTHAFSLIIQYQVVHILTLVLYRYTIGLTLCHKGSRNGAKANFWILKKLIKILTKGCARFGPIFRGTVSEFESRERLSPLALHPDRARSDESVPSKAVAAKWRNPVCFNAYNLL